MKRVGALWEKTDKDGTYLTGTLDLGVFGQVRVGVFVNDRKENERQPTHNVVLFEDSE